MFKDGQFGDLDGSSNMDNFDKDMDFQNQAIIDKLNQDIEKANEIEQK